MKRGDIVFVQGKGLISRMIRYVDEGKYSHVAVAASSHKVIEADIDTKVAVREFYPEEYNVVDVIDLGLSRQKRMDVYNASLRMIGVRYDYPQLIWYVLRKFLGLKGRNKLNNPRNYICSELVFLVLEEAGILKELGIQETARRGIDLTPNELYDLVNYVSSK